ncbi:MAG: gfo/Idh/MocA family oxidoreductase, partial [Planctomycetota bacterium]
MAIHPRRTFLKQNLALGTGALLAANAKAAETTLKVGFIGPGGMGTNHLKLLVQRKDVSIDYICEPDAIRLANAV